MNATATKIASIAPYLFALAMIGFGVQELITGKFLMTRVPIALGGAPMAYVTGVLLIASGALLLLRKNVLHAATLLAAIILIWAILPRFPSVMADRIFGDPWTNLFKGLSLWFGCFVVGVTLLPSSSGKAPAGLKDFAYKVAPLCRFVIGTFFIIGGIQHFKFAQFVQTLVPAWIPPSQLFWTYFAGVALLLGGIGMMVKKTHRLAAFWSGVMVFTWFLILHIPRALVNVNDAGEWIGVLESLALSAVLLTISGYRKD